MSLWFGTGADFNFVKRAGTIAAGNVVLSPDAADANFPATYLYDGRPGTECRFAAISADEKITVDLQAILNGGFEGGFTATVPNSWTAVGAGTTADDTVNMRTGAHAVKITSTAGITRIEQAVTAVPGEAWAVNAYAKVLTGTPTANTYIFNRQTNRYWNGSTWQTARVASNSSSSGSYTFMGSNFTVEDALTCGNLPNVEIVLQLEATQGGATPAVVFDDIEVVPAVNFCGLFGHQVDPFIVPTLESSPDNSAWTLRSTLDAKYAPTVYGFTSGNISARYWRVKFTGTQSTRSGAISIGELVIAQLTQGLRNPGYPIATSWDELQQRNFSAVGSQWVYALSGGPVRTLALLMDTRGTMPSASFRQVRDQLFRLSRNGLYPVVLVPQDTDAEVCVYGRVMSTITYGQTFLTVTQINGFAVVEDALPTRVL